METKHFPDGTYKLYKPYRLESEAESMAEKLKYTFKHKIEETDDGYYNLWIKSWKPIGNV